MNIIFATLLILSVIALILTNPSEVFPTLINGVSDGIALIIKLAAIYTVWLGVLKAMERSNLDKKLCKLLLPLTKRLFKNESEKAYTFISLNIASNMLGMGGAATPMGINAVNEMYRGNDTASDNMLLLLVLNATSVQIIPATIIALRASLGSANAADIFAPTLIATAVSTMVGVLTCKCISSRNRLFMLYKRKHKLGVLQNK